MMRAKKGLVLGLVLSSSLLLAACSQESTEDARYGNRRRDC